MNLNDLNKKTQPKKIIHREIFFIIDRSGNEVFIPPTERERLNVHESYVLYKKSGIELAFFPYMYLFISLYNTLSLSI